MGYAFVDLTTAEEAQRAITELSGHSVLDRKVSVQEARKPETPAEKAAAAGASEGTDANGRRKSSGGRGRARARGGRNRTGGRGGRVSSILEEALSL